MPWSRSGRRSHRTPLVISSGACPNVVVQAHKLLSTFLSCCNGMNQQNRLAYHNIFSLRFLGWCWLIRFICIKWCAVFSFLTHISNDIWPYLIPHWDLICFLSVPIIFLSSVHQDGDLCFQLNDVKVIVLGVYSVLSVLPFSYCHHYPRLASPASVTPDSRCSL